MRSCSPVLPLEAPPAPPLGAPASGVAAGGDPDNGGGDDSSSHDTTSLLTLSRKDGLLDPSLATLLAGVTSTMRSTPCYVGHLTGVLGLSSIDVWSSSTVAGSTRIAGRRPAWCAVQRTVSGVLRSAFYQCDFAQNACKTMRTLLNLTAIYQTTSIVITKNLRK